MKRWMMTTAIVMTSVLLAGCTTSDPVMRDVDRCWVEIYEGEHFASQRSWTRIQGPSELRNLRELAGRDWNDSISSIRVGPGATVEVFEHADFRGQSEIFSSGRQVSTLRDFGLNNEISSIRTRCD